MKKQLTNKLVIAISSRALFDLSESHTVYEKDGINAYAHYQITHENKVLEPGPAFPLVKKLLAIHTPGEEDQDENRLVEVILLSRNSADTGLRIFNSIEHYDLPITRAAFTSGGKTFQYISAFHSHLFLSSHAEDVRDALANHCAAATILNSQIGYHDGEQLRIAFDGDAVLFSDESEAIYQQQGLTAFKENEARSALKPLSAGPFKGFLSALQHIQKQFPPEHCPIRTALVTARSAPAHERVIRTLRAWDIRIDEALFLGGLSKGDFLKAFAADIFFDDQKIHCQSAVQHVATGHVPNGILNES